MNKWIVGFALCSVTFGAQADTASPRQAVFIDGMSKAQTQMCLFARQLLDQTYSDAAREAVAFAKARAIMREFPCET